MILDFNILVVQIRSNYLHYIGLLLIVLQFQYKSQARI